MRPQRIGTWHILTEQFRASFDRRAEGVERGPFVKWARTIRDPQLRIKEAWWGRMWTGNPVPTEFIEAFGEYCEEVLKLPNPERFKMKALAEPAEPPEEETVTQMAKASIFVMGWLKLWEVFAKPFSIPELSFCRNRDDIAEAARITLACVASHFGYKGSEDELIKRGESEVGMTLEQFTEMLFRFWSLDRNTVLLAVVPSKNGGWRRLGASVIVPLSQKGRNEFRNGLLDDTGFTDEHISIPSDCIHATVIADRPLTPKPGARLRKQIEMALLRLQNYQCAYFLPAMTNDALPQVLTMAATPQSEKKLIAYDFVKVGNVTPRRGYPIYEFTEPSADTRRSMMPKYMIFKAIMSMAQDYVRKNEEISATTAED